MFKDPVHIIKTYQETISDGAGLRYSIYLAGCRHRCKGCHNPESRDPEQGILLSEQRLEQIIREINNNSLLDGVTFSGGDPFFYPETLLILLKTIKEKTGQNIWCYTGYTLEQLQEQPFSRECLQYIDVLVDGQYIADQHSPLLRFRGSSNQRLIDLKNNRMIE